MVALQDIQHGFPLDHAGRDNVALPDIPGKLRIVVL
jgi:hypothetical protein